MNLIDILSLILPVAFTLFILSLAYGDNPLYEFGAHLLIGAAAGWDCILIINFIYKTGLILAISGKPHYFLSIILGLLMFTRFIPRYRWIYRYPMAVVIGTGTGLAINGAIGAQIIKQLTASFLPLTKGDAFLIISNVLIIIGSITSLTYFLFTQRFRSGFLEKIGKIGRYFIMAALGAVFGSVITFRINVLIGRIDFLTKPYVINYSIIITVLVLIFLILYDKLKH